MLCQQCQKRRPYRGGLCRPCHWQEEWERLSRTPAYQTRLVRIEQYRSLAERGLPLFAATALTHTG